MEHESGHKVRIAQRGWNGDQAAATLEDVQVGIGIPWVEIDGHRFSAITGVTFAAAGEIAALPAITVEVVGPVEVVYVDRDGEPLTGDGVQSSLTEDDAGVIDARTLRPAG